jgi:hypothetical protein
MGHGSQAFPFRQVKPQTLGQAPAVFRVRLEEERGLPQLDGFWGAPQMVVNSDILSGKSRSFHTINQYFP